MQEKREYPKQDVLTVHGVIETIYESQGSHEGEDWKRWAIKLAGSDKVYSRFLTPTNRMHTAHIAEGDEINLKFYEKTKKDESATFPTIVTINKARA